MTSLPSIGFIKLLIMALALGYLTVAAFAFLMGNRLTFPAPPPGYLDSEDIIKIPYDRKGRRVSMLYLDQPGSHFLVFYHHGNGEDLQSILPRLQALRQLGCSVLAWDYPGYGTSDGQPSERLILEIADQIWREIPDRFGYTADRIILYGRSIGGGPASWLSARYQPGGLVMEGSFTSVFRVVTGVRILPWDLFNNLSWIGSINCPVLFLHGTRDRTVPFRHSRQLLERAPEPKFFTWFEKGRHNDLLESYADTYSSSLRRFLTFLRTGEN